MRGDPAVMPFAFCQWFDHCVRFSLYEPERRLPDFDLVHRPIAQHLRELPEDLVVVFLGRIRGCRVVGGGGQTERLPQPAAGRP